MLNTLRGSVLAAALLIAGCNSTPARPVTPYMPASDLTAENAASLTGSRLENPNILVGDVRVYVTHIDSAPTQGPGYPDPDKILLVPPGTHYVRMILARNDFWRSRSSHACIEQFIELEAGKVYVARGELKGREANLWLDQVGSTNEQARTTAGVSITDQVRVGYMTMPVVRASKPCAS